MHFFKFFLALVSVLVVTITAAPTESKGKAVVAVPDPKSPTYEADLAAVIAYARTAGLNPNPKSSHAAAGVQCGSFSIVEGGFTVPTYTTDGYCNETDQYEHMKKFWNWWCGLCIVFEGRACQGNIKWSGGPEPQGPHDGHEVQGAQSYFCY